MSDETRRVYEHRPHPFYRFFIQSHHSHPHYPNLTHQLVRKSHVNGIRPRVFDSKWYERRFGPAGRIAIGSAPRTVARPLIVDAQQLLAFDLQ
jgi:hypothetical protein